jgi:MOSC domain-containing protein YiiM
MLVPPKDSGRVILIVRRCGEGVRETPGRARLCTEAGLFGDEWCRRPTRDVEAQLAVMRADVAKLIANGRPLTMFGDNVFVDLDISNANLPAGTRLRLGEAVVEVTPKPHTGCGKFHSRFGENAFWFVNAAAGRHQNLRGIYWRVIESGEVSVYDTIEVLTRTGAP